MLPFLNFFLIFKWISTIKKFADVSANIMFDWKLASWMFAHECFNVKYQIVKQNKFFSVFDTVVELFKSHNFNIFCELFLILQRFPVSNFKKNDYKQHNGHMKIFKWKVTRMSRIDSVKMDSSCNSKIWRNQNKIS